MRCGLSATGTGWLRSTRLVREFGKKLLLPHLGRGPDDVSQKNRSILRGMLIVAVFLITAKLLAAGKEVLVAYRFGTSGTVDGYLFVFNLAQWPISVFASVFGFVVIPYFVRLQSEEPDEAVALYHSLIPVVFLLGVTVSLAFAGASWWLIDQNLVGFTGESLTSAEASIPWVAVAIVFAFVSTTFSSWLMSKRKHTNTLLEATPAVAIALSLLFWSVDPGEDWPVLPLAVGTSVGFFIQALLLSRFSGAGIGIALRPMGAKHWAAIRKSFGVMLLAQVVITTSGLMDQFFAIRMGEGVLASYSYAQRVMALVLGLSAVVVGRAMLPELSGIKDPRESYQVAKRWAIWLGALGAAGTILLAVFSETAVSLLFERGAFTSSDTDVVSQTLALLGTQLPFYLFGIVFVQWIGANGKPRILLFAAFAGIVAKLVGVSILFDWEAAGLAISTAAMYAASASAIGFLTSRESRNC